VNEAIAQALEKDRLIDITTTGRKSGRPHRVEIGFHVLDDGLFIAGIPGRRDWLANLAANPQFTFHLKESVQMDIPATATLITVESQRREVFAKLAEQRQGGRPMDVDAWVEDSPLIQVELHAPA
jgi:deazaflavin-dependent oxidoreductase (nitroreductase family)